MDNFRKIFAKRQLQLAAQVEIPENREFPLRDGDVVLGLDIQYDGNDAHVAGDLHYWGGEHIATIAGLVSTDIPYVPGYFCFREGPPLLSLIEKIKQESLPNPNLIVVDGHGLAHPRRFGVACWLGIASGLPTIGCAKDTLVQYEGELAKPRGSVLEVFVEGEVVGHVVRRKHGVNPVFVSPGHLVSLEDAVAIILDLPGKFRIPDTIRHADQAARSHCKGIAGETWGDIGELTPVLPPWEQ